MNKNKILFLYNGVNETKFLDDRKLSRPIETTRILASNLGLSNRFFDDTNVEIGFKFNNNLTKDEDRFLTAFFTSTAPISTTTNAIATKTAKSSNSNIAKDLIVEKTMIALFVADNADFRDKIGTDLAVVHMGLIMPNGVLRHASSERGMVVDVPFEEYVNARKKNKNNLGIALVEIK